jgi:hypothetical protein
MEALMPVALYYPHTTVKDRALLKNAMLLWDEVECITPSFGKRNHYFGEALWDEATELIVKDRVPTEDERREVHKEVLALVDAGLPTWEWLQSDLPGFQDRYPIYPDKLGAETWHLLEDHALSSWRADGDAEMGPALGLLIMSLLADACAGREKRKITDRVPAYSTLAKCLAVSAGTRAPAEPQSMAATADYEHMVGLTVRLLNTDDIPILRLVELRRREMREGSSDYRHLRKRYVEKIEALRDRIAASSGSASDVREIERQFQEDMRDDLNDLCAELRVANRKALFSKEVVIGATALIAAAVSPLGGFGELATVLSPVGIGALLNTSGDHSAARRKALRSHSMSWLHLARAT